MSMCRAPSSSDLATVCCWFSRDVLVRSKCIWFWPALLLLSWKKSDPEPGVIARQERDAVLGVVGHLPAQEACPEARETERVVRIDAEREELTSHNSSLDMAHGSALSGARCWAGGDQGEGVDQSPPVGFSQIALQDIGDHRQGVHKLWSEVGRIDVQMI